MYVALLPLLCLIVSHMYRHAHRIHIGGDAMILLHFSQTDRKRGKLRANGYRPIQGIPRRHNNIFSIR